VTSTHCAAIDEHALVLRVSGSLDQFGPEAVGPIKRRRSSRYITADIVIPEYQWVNVPDDQLKRYLVAIVREALLSCIERLKADREAVDEHKLLQQYDAACTSFLEARVA
jgi:hypothetical protein